MEIFKFSQMITDNETNFLWLADSLPKKFPDFYKRFEKLLIENKVEYQLLPQTKDVWAVDYMPVDSNSYWFRINHCSWCGNL